MKLLSGLDVFWIQLTRDLESGGWESGVLPVAELLGQLHLTIRELGDLMNRLFTLFVRLESKAGSSAGRSEYLFGIDEGSSKTSIAAGSSASGVPERSEKQHSAVLIVLSASLRTCVLRWMSNRPEEFVSMFLEEKEFLPGGLLSLAAAENAPSSSSIFRSRSKSVDCMQSSQSSPMALSTEIIRELIAKLEKLATGTTKRLYIWPTLVVLCCLLPKDLKRAVQNMQVIFDKYKSTVCLD